MSYDTQNTFWFQILTLQNILDGWPPGMEKWTGLQFHWKADEQTMSVVLLIVLKEDLIRFDMRISRDDSFYTKAAELAQRVITKLTPEHQGEPWTVEPS